MERYIKEFKESYSVKEMQFITDSFLDFLIANYYWKDIAEYIANDPKEDYISKNNIANLLIKVGQRIKNLNKE